MIRGAIAVVAGLIVWTVCATAVNIALRFALAGYAAAEPDMQFTLTMMIARLALPGAVPSIAAGFAAAWISRGERAAIAALSIILFAAFVPIHYQLWTRFPLWYHLVFLGSLLLLPWLGARLKSAAAAEAEASPAG
jgi:hypothetical protein